MAGDEKQQWYSNKDLFEMIQRLHDELSETREIIRKYNGLRQDLGETLKLSAENEKKISEISNTSQGKYELAETIRKWGGWLVAIASLIYAITS